MSTDYSPFVVSNWLLRTVIGKVPAQEFAVLMFIYSRTYAWNKSSEIISKSHFLDGFLAPGSDELAQVGLPISSRTLYRCLRNLNDAGYIHTTTSTRGSRYEICYAQKYSVVSPMALTSVTHGTTGCQKRRSVVPPVAHYKNNSKKQDIRKTSNTSHGGAGDIQGDDLKPIEKVRAALVEARAKTSLARDKRKSGSGLESYEKTWADLVREFFPDVRVIPAWTIPQATMFKRALTKDLAAVDAKAFLGKVIANWGEIMRDQFGGVANAPRTPALMFFLKCIGSFYEAVLVLDGAAPARVKRLPPPRIKAASDEAVETSQRIARELAFENAHLKRKLAASETARLSAPRLPPRPSAALRKPASVELVDPATLGLPQWDE